MFLTVFCVVLWSVFIARDQNSNLSLFVRLMILPPSPSLLPNSLRSCVVWCSVVQCGDLMVVALPQYGYPTMSRELLMIGFATLWQSGLDAVAKNCVVRLWQKWNSVAMKLLHSISLHSIALYCRKISSVESNNFNSSLKSVFHSAFRSNCSQVGSISNSAIWLLS